MFKVLNGFLVLVALVTLSCGGGGDDDDINEPSGDDSKDTSSRATPTSEDLVAIANTAVPGFTALDPRGTGLGATVVYSSDTKTSGGANVQVLVSLVACDPFICGKLDPDQYSSPEAQRNLKSILPTAHIENPDLQWEFGTVDLSGETGLYTYALSYVESKDNAGGTTRLSANAYRAWYHDGRIFVSMDVYARGITSVSSVEDLEAGMSKAEAEKAAKDVFAALKPALDKD
ncbi:MAG: hypothetical protein AB7N24_08710 [Dehalococcoidia bacterium]